MDNESIGIRGVGLCTAGIGNVEELCDQIIDHGKRYKKKEENLENSVQKALEEANAQEEPVIWVTTDHAASLSLYQALEQAREREHTAIICTQTNEDSLTEAAVLFTSTIEEEPMWATIKQGKIGGESPFAFLKLYKKRGPVQEAGEIIMACITLRYGMHVSPLNKDGWYWRTEKKEILELPVAIHGGAITLREPQVLLTEPIRIEKQLVPVSFGNREEGIQKLNHLLSISERLSLNDLSKNTRKGFLQSRTRKRTVVFAAKEKEALQVEVKAFLSVQSKWDNPGYLWKTKEGSFYTANLVRRNAKVALISPPFGMFSKLRFYRLYRAIPKLKKDIDEVTVDPQKTDQLVRHYTAESVSRSLTVSALRELGIPFDVAAGVSIGETYLPAILDDMEHEESIAELIEMLIKEQPKLEQQYFKEVPEGDIEKWYVICDQEAVLQAIDAVGNGEVFLTVVGSRSEGMICGRGSACNRVLEQLGTYGVRVEDPLYTHTPMLTPIRDRIKESLTSREILLKRELAYQIYSSCLQQRMDGSVEGVADAVTESIMRRANFPEVLEHLYQMGCRVFFDISSGKICSKWMRETFRNHDDIVVTSFFEEANVADSLSFLLAQLMSYGVSIRYQQFYETLDWEDNGQKDVRTELLERLLECGPGTRTNYRILEDHMQCKTAEIKGTGKDKGWNCLYRQSQIEEMSNGSMMKLFGETYKGIDEYERRIRLPSPPLLFVSRITRIAASYGTLDEESYMEGALDLTKDTFLLVNGRWASGAVLTEAGQIGWLLASYLGMDAQMNGQAGYRITDVTKEFYGGRWPKIGDTVKLCYHFDRFIKNKDRIVFFATYEIEFLGKPWMQFKQMGEFFCRESAISRRHLTETEKPEVMLQERCPLYHPLTGRHQFSNEQLHAFLQGDLAGCFGEKGTGRPLLYWASKEAHFVDQILDISSEGGSYGYGYIFGEKEIEEDFWPFSVSVKNDPFLPTCILEEMVTQVITFFECYMGLHGLDKEEVPELVKNHPNRTRFGEEVRPGYHLMIIKAEPRVVKKIQDHILLIYDGAVYCDGIQIVKQEGIAHFLS